MSSLTPTFTSINLKNIFLFLTIPLFGVSLRSMKIFFLKNVFILLIISQLLVSCNKEYNKVIKSPDVDYKLEMADKYYAKGDFDKCIPLYEEILIYFKGKKNVEKAYYNYANAHYEIGEYQLAAFYFKSFTNSYPKSELAEKASFMVAQCYVAESPRFSLDPTSTNQAVTQIQNFTDKYPNSSEVDSANKVMDLLRAKLMKKKYESAYLYYKIRNYNAAAVSFRSLLEEYPDFYDPEKAELYIIKSDRQYANNSYTAKQQERHKQTIKDITSFQKKYPNSKFMKEITEIQKATEKDLNINTNGKENNRKEKRGS